MKKRQDDDKWYLHQVDPDVENSYGCGFQTEVSSKKEIWDQKINNLVTYHEISFKDNMNIVKNIYPKSHPGMTVKIRHGGDPLLIALQLSPSLNFGMTSSQEF